jgi:hypothetical protein
LFVSVKLQDDSQAPSGRDALATFDQERTFGKRYIFIRVIIQMVMAYSTLMME